MRDDRMRRQRFELKYVVTEKVALAARGFVSGYLDIDEYGATLPNNSYPVHSLYLDSDGLQLYWTTINGDRNRFKLRLRYYDERPESPVFFEIKQRMNNVILKQRGGVRREAVDALLTGHPPEPAHLVSRDPRQFTALQNFCRLMGEIRARPRTHVAYLREAWIGRDGSPVRVTMDRDVSCEAEPGVRLATRMTNPMPVFGGQVVLELKYTDRFPEWFKQLVRVFGLMQRGAAKYADGVSTVGFERVKRTVVLDNS